ncbi:ATP-binding protein [Nodosilinea nodulosa]|uniref:ATP-binding protein n=1 Tax=Nodosilinea nodulosa TaxID=416001 RepID=UPI000474D8D6|nr:ATP-binding protein [Nodosilinea nodulosa]
MTSNAMATPVTFSPALRAADASANDWLRQATLRLRREICWRWHQQGYSSTSTTLPPVDDRLSESLDLTRYWQDKQQFFTTDVTARYLTEQLGASPAAARTSTQGTFVWVVDTLGLDPAAAFVLALALLAAFDPAAGAAIATCQNNLAATQPTLALAQKLWDEPADLLPICDRGHPLWRYGLLGASPDATPGDWHTPLTVPPLLAHQLLFSPADLPPALTLWPLETALLSDLSATGQLVANRLCVAASHLRIVPIQGPAGAPAQATIQGMAQITQRPVAALKETATASGDYLSTLLTLCWLRGLDVFLPERTADKSGGQPGYPELQSLTALPIAVFWQMRDRTPLTPFASEQVLPIVDLPRLGYRDRIQTWYRALGFKEAEASPALQQEIAECARRFRYEPQTIHRIAQSLARPGDPSKLSTLHLAAACRAEMGLDIGDLAQPVTPRFSDSDLVLPPKQHQQFQEILQAMAALTQVHYQWGTARAWNECGISVLFAGPPGTGKTMAAEALANQLGLPMYRIDLSQVVNKYIGETEKNLKRLFDTADISDTVLFFDEADALFGRRTEVKDAHDRYANLEISYLLERMERFKGLAILATNRQKDLDEAFLRRLRYIIEFPLPDERDRRRLWQQLIPPQVDASQLDIDFLARQFPLAGGHIRSIIFNACLQTVHPSSSPSPHPPLSSSTHPPPTLTMNHILIAIKREYDKLNRSVSQTQFGPYAPLIESLDRA